MIHKMIETGESFDEALVHYQAAFQIAETNGNQRMQAENLFQMAYIYYWQTDYFQTLAKTKKGLSIAKRLNDSEMLFVGYDLLAQLHYLLSPEQAEFYFRKCRQYSNPADSVELAVSSLNSFSLINYFREVDLSEFLSMDVQKLSPLTRACLGCNIARSLIAGGNVDDAARYLEYTRQYLEQHSETKPLNVMYELRMGQLKLLEGNTKQAWEYVNKCIEMIRKNRMLMGFVQIYNLSSQIAQAENQEVLALKYYKMSISLRDSIFDSSSNLNFVDELISTMKELMADEREKTAKNNYLLLGIGLGLALIAGISLLYYFKSKGYHRKNSTALVNIRNHATYDLHSRMKNHLMKILYGYKDGVSYCLKQIFEAENSEFLGDVTVFDQNMKKVYALIDRLLGWVETNSEMNAEISEFDITETVQQLVFFYKVKIADQHITFQLSDKQPIVVQGDKNMLMIALEHLFYILTKVSKKHAVIYISLSKNDGKYATVSIADPENQSTTLEKEIFAQRVAELESTGKTPHTADWDFNIFAEFTLRNRAKARMECSPEKGTVYEYWMYL